MVDGKSVTRSMSSFPLESRARTAPPSPRLSLMDLSVFEDSEHRPMLRQCFVHGSSAVLLMLAIGCVRAHDSHRDHWPPRDVVRAFRQKPMDYIVSRVSGMDGTEAQKVIDQLFAHPSEEVRRKALQVAIGARLPTLPGLLTRALGDRSDMVGEVAAREWVKSAHPASRLSSVLSDHSVSCLARAIVCAEVEKLASRVWAYPIPVADSGKEGANIFEVLGSRNSVWAANSGRHKYWLIGQSDGPITLMLYFGGPRYQLREHGRWGEWSEDVGIELGGYRGLPGYFEKDDRHHVYYLAASKEGARLYDDNAFQKAAEWCKRSGTDRHGP